MGPYEITSPYLHALYSMWVCVHHTVVFPQNGREDLLLSNALMTPPRSSTFLDTSLHKDVFGVISGTCEWTDDYWELKNTYDIFLLFHFFFDISVKLLLFCCRRSVASRVVDPQHQLSATGRVPRLTHQH